MADVAQVDKLDKKLQINPASDGPWRCPTCKESFVKWAGFARHVRAMKHFTITSKMTLARKRYADLQFHKKHPGYGTKAYSRVDDHSKKTRTRTGIIAVMPYEDGFLIIVPSPNGEPPRTFYGYPVTLKLQKPVRMP